MADEGGRVVVLGGGSTGEAFAAALRRLDREVPITLVERELLGGECTYWACMPSKTLLRPLELVAAGRRAPGAAEAVTGDADWARILWWRDRVTDELDDSGHETWLADRQVEVVRGAGRVAHPGLLQVGERVMEYEKLVVATGSAASAPPIDGLEESGYWTNREATTTRELPASLLVLGGAVVGCELALAAVNVAGGDARADYPAIPSVAFTDPQVASVGRTDGNGVVSASWAVDATSRSSTYERPKRRGFVRLFADPKRRVLAGAVAVGPEAGEWIGQITLAIQAEVPLEVLRSTIQPFPTFSEALFFAARELQAEEPADT